MGALRLVRLTIIGDGVPDVYVEFGPSLTIIYGSSNTGKSYVVDALDFMLGGKTLRAIPEAEPYRRVMLSMTLPDDSAVTLVRNISGGHFGVYFEHLVTSPRRTADLALSTTLNAETANRISLSRYLLQSLGLDGKEVRKNQQNVTVRLSLRHLIFLCVIDETKIQSRVPPPMSGQYVNATVEMSVFKLLLQGEDDSKFAQEVGASERRKVSRGKAEILEQAIAELKGLVSDNANVDELRAQLVRLTQSLEERSASTDAVLESRSAMIGELTAVMSRAHTYRSRLDEVTELIARFDLLRLKYDSDLERLEMVREAGTLLGYFRPGICVFCGAAVEHQAAEEHSAAEITSFGESVIAEIQKTRGLRDDLDLTIVDLRTQRGLLLQGIAGFAETARRLESEISALDHSLEPQRVEMQELLTTRSTIETALARHEQIGRLLELRATVEPDVEEPVRQAPGINEHALSEFSRMLAQVVHDWSVPVVDHVTYSKSENDILIDGQPRGSQGKGMRAILHAAFTAALGQYCLERGVEHPGFIVLDSPLVTYREPEPGVADAPEPEQFQHVTNSLFAYFDQQFDGQSIIIENTDPPADLSNDTTLIHFTGNTESGRYGFFPPIVRPSGS